MELVSDVFDAVLGQDRAVSALRHYAAHPVHAYLFTGPAGAGMREALVAFTAALQCPDKGCGSCEACRLALSLNDSDVTWCERSGTTWKVEELAEAERVSRRRPLGVGHQIVVIENIELAASAGAKLLKILEEPPSRTIFLLTAEALPDSLATIMSRCIEVPFSPLSIETITEYLVREGFDALGARAAATASGGDLRRAQVLVRDTDLATRIAMWQSIPDRLSGVSAQVAQVALDVSAAIDAAMVPLTDLQTEEMERRAAEAKSLGQRGVPRRKEIEQRFRREQRRFRTEDLRFGLSALTHVYRQRLVEGLEGLDDGDRRSRVMAQGALRCIDEIDRASRGLQNNIDEQLMLTNLFLTLARQ